MSLTEARARLAERVASIVRSRIGGRVPEEAYDEVQKSIADLTKQIRDTLSEVERARRACSDAEYLLYFVSDAEAESRP